MAPLMLLNSFRSCHWFQSILVTQRRERGDTFPIKSEWNDDYVDLGCWLSSELISRVRAWANFTIWFVRFHSIAWVAYDVGPSYLDTIREEGTWCCWCLRAKQLKAFSKTFGTFRWYGTGIRPHVISLLHSSPWINASFYLWSGL